MGWEGCYGLTANAFLFAFLFVFRAVSTTTATTYCVPAGGKRSGLAVKMDGLDLWVCVSFFACRGCDEKARQRGGGRGAEGFGERLRRGAVSGRGDDQEE
jgi:hypothetical protein